MEWRWEVTLVMAWTFVSKQQLVPGACIRSGGVANKAATLLLCCMRLDHSAQLWCLLNQWEGKPLAC
jgi:hypothetical protein